MSRLSRKIERRGARGFDELRRKLHGQQKYMVTVRPLLEALLDPRIATGVAEFVAVALRSAVTARPNRECFCCRATWSPSRGVASIVLIEFLGHATGLVCGVCTSCADAQDLQAKILAGIRRDLGEASEIRWASGPGHA